MKKIIPIFMILTFLISAMWICGCVGSGNPSGTSDTGTPAGNENQAGKTHINITDSEGRSVTIPYPVHKIVALNSNTAEILVALGAGDTVVGLSDPTFVARPWLLKYMNSPTKVGDLFAPNTEQIISLHPDVVIAYRITKTYSDKIEQSGIPVLYLAADDINDFAPSVRILGEITGKSEKAEKLATFYEDTLAQVDTRLGNLTDDQRPSVYFERYSDYSAVTPNSETGALINRTGGRNILTVPSMDTPHVSPEWVVNQNPDIIIRAVNTADNPDIDLVPYYQHFFSDPRLVNISAVKNGRVYAMTGEMLYGSRSFSGILAMAKILHPELFPDIDPMQKIDEYAQMFIPEAKNQGARMYPAL